MEDRLAVRDPTNNMGGQYSLPFTPAVALMGDMHHPLVYNEQTIADPPVRDLAMLIELIPDEAMQIGPGVFPAEITIEWNGQKQTLATAPHKGSPRNPMIWKDACAIFERFTGTLISAERAAAIMEAVGRLDQSGNVAGMAGLLAGK